MSNLLKPLTELILISTALSLAFCNSALSFFKYFCLFIIVQLFVYNIYKGIVALFAEKLKNDRIKEYSKQGMEITCPCYMEKKMLLPIDLNAPNSFKCDECEKNFSVDVSARTFLQTETIDLNKADAAFVEAYKKIQETK